MIRLFGVITCLRLATAAILLPSIASSSAPYSAWSMTPLAMADLSRETLAPHSEASFPPGPNTL